MTLKLERAQQLKPAVSQSPSVVVSPMWSSIINRSISILNSTATRNALTITASTAIPLALVQKLWKTLYVPEPVLLHQDVIQRVGRLTWQEVFTRGLTIGAAVYASWKFLSAWTTEEVERELEIIADARPARAGGIIKFEIEGYKYVWHYSVDWQEQIGYSRIPHEQEPSDMEIANALLAALIARQALDQMRYKQAKVNVTIKLDNNVIWGNHELWTEIEEILGCVPRKVKEEKASSVDMKHADTLSRGLWEDWQQQQDLYRTHYDVHESLQKNEEAQYQLLMLESYLRMHGKLPNLGYRELQQVYF